MGQSMRKFATFLSGPSLTRELAIFHYCNGEVMRVNGSQLSPVLLLPLSSFNRAPLPSLAKLEVVRHCVFREMSHGQYALCLPSCRYVYSATLMPCDFCIMSSRHGKLTTFWNLTIGNSRCSFMHVFQGMWLWLKAIWMSRMQACCQLTMVASGL